MWQKYVHKVQTWKDNWNDIIRYVIYPDPVMRELMCLNDDVSITQFRDKYFTKGKNTTNEIVTDEKVRILWYDNEGRDSGNMHVRNRYKEFDIYVKNDVLHNATDDRLQFRHELIAQRLKELLIGTQYVRQMRFQFQDEYDLWTKTAGYSLYHIAFSYKATT